MKESSVITAVQVYSFIVMDDQDESRLDTFFTQHFTDYSRTFFSTLIRKGCVSINNKVTTKTGATVKKGNRIILNVPTTSTKPSFDKEQIAKLGVTLIHQEKDFAIINKPAGLMTHASRHNSNEPSLVTWLLESF